MLDAETLSGPLALVLALQLVAVFGEEIGWRGLVQPLLEKRFSAVWAGTLTGLLSAAGYLVVVPERYPVFAAMAALGIIAGSVGISVLLAVLTSGFTLLQRVLIATLFRMVLVVGFLVLFSGGDGTWLWEVNTGVALGVVALVVVRMNRRRKNRIELADRYGTAEERAILR